MTLTGTNLRNSSARRLPALGLMVAITVLPAGATHFRYGHYTWRPVSGNTIEFTVQNAFRRDGFVCVKTAAPTIFIPCTGSSGFAGVGDIVPEFIGGTRFNFGDGTSVGSPAGPLLYLVTSIDPDNWLFAVALDPAAFPSIKTTITHTYSSTGTFRAFTDSCCRISAVDLNNAHLNNPDGGYRVETLVNVATGNSPPVSNLPPIVVCPQQSICTFFVPAGDANGDRIRFRLSTASEASSSGFRQPGPPSAPNAASIDNLGLYTWNTTGALLGPIGTNTLYSTQVTIEDLDVGGNVKSKTAVDFLIQLVPKVGVPPVFNPPPEIVCGASQSLAVGQQLTATVSASDPDPGQIVQLNVAGLPPGATMTPTLPVVGNPISSVFSWTPTAVQVGTNVVIFTARDNTGQQALCSQTINVLTPVFGGRMTGGGSVASAAGNVAKHGFELNCNSNDSPNNLEVNWDDGKRFHLVAVTSSACVNDPTILAKPPNSQFNTLLGSGTGTLNGEDGASARWTLTDAGEPGTGDSAKLIIRDSHGNVVLNILGNLQNGDQQAHDK